MPNQFPKQCRCCRLTHTVASWAALTLVGFGSGLEFRNCSCGSTLAVLASAEAA